ncbi:MAG: M20/M25/M40 family metallo-hydrolase [Candidatus Ancillula sp.]|jgi:acetylornithine deacetylase/succinyl-diaminopimelate desuccinylase-like protein|nr:M20/M25/M40 family metallo-hydrolase [Candidatus Ancillula sp.]
MWYNINMTIKDAQDFEVVFQNVYEKAVETLEDLVRIPSVSVGVTRESVEFANIEKSAEFVSKLLTECGVVNKIVNAETVDESSGSSRPGNPAVIGSLGAGINGELDAKKPTVLLYAHHDVQPALYPENWKTNPFEPTHIQSSTGPRLFGRGAADDGAGLVAHLGAIGLYRALGVELPVNLKIFIEGEEECGSPSFNNFIKKYKDELSADVIIVADSSNWAVGVPAITTSLRGVSTIDIALNVLEHTIHSGMSSGPIIDANALLMCTISSIWDEQGNIVVDGLLGARGNELPEPTVDYSFEQFANDSSLLDGVLLAGTGTISGRIWTKPSVTVIGFDATSTANASNVFAASSKARLSLRVAPGQDSTEAANALVEHLSKNVPFGAKFSYTILESGPSFVADTTTNGTLALKSALEEAFGKEVVYAGMGGSIPFVADLKETFEGVDVLLIGVEDPDSRAHSDNESVQLEDLKKIILALGLLFEKLGSK